MISFDALSLQFTNLVNTLSVTPTPQGMALGMALSFAGGVVSSLLPCTLTMLPVLLALMGINDTKAKASCWVLAARKVLLFVLGVCLTMAVLGILSGMLGWVFGGWIGPWLYASIGVLLIIVGGVLASLPGFRLLSISRFGFSRFPHWASSSEGWGPLFLGIAMGLIASPCGTPYLAAILGLISYSQRWALGGLYLFAYALGQSAVLIIAGLGAGWLQHVLALRALGNHLQKISGALFLLLGALLLIKSIS
ncbi:MAG: cytochrome c biogenesis protein CcdA [Vampirovibrionales bacterium]|nr:cytochrome c biogenesis protein CcdA [Vampirovibrionales bacterium]